VTPIPGPRSRALADRLAGVESRNVTCLSPHPPIFWDRAAGSNVWDVDGNRFVDVSAAFAVANTGHRRWRAARTRRHRCECIRG
jgi:4-aminobutyrate aminotransferase/(S)-3-amino-2-methylpropionate transaminase